MQCGWPMHKFCYKKSDMVRVKCPPHCTPCILPLQGCPGVCNNKYTLSGKGFPCQNDPTK